MTTPSHFLALPVELRLHIYNFTISTNPAITIGTARLTGPEPAIIHRLYGDGRSPYPGIPEYHEPVIEEGYNASLLSTTKPYTIAADQTHTQHQYEASTALRLVCRKIHDELRYHFQISNEKKDGRHHHHRPSLFIQYPHGLHILSTKSPHLLASTPPASIHLAGHYTPTTGYTPTHAAFLPQQTQHTPPKLHAGVTPDSTTQLTHLITSLPPTTTLTLRIYYPGPDSYSTVWGDDCSPVGIVLRYTSYAEINIEVWRGREGTGVLVVVRPNSSAEGGGERKRTVSTVWRKLDEGGGGGEWVVDPRWPEWGRDGQGEEEGVGVGGREGEVVVTRAA